MFTLRDLEELSFLTWVMTSRFNRLGELIMRGLLLGLDGVVENIPDDDGQVSIRLFVPLLLEAPPPSLDKH